MKGFANRIKQSFHYKKLESFFIDLYTDFIDLFIDLFRNLLFSEDVAYIRNFEKIARPQIYNSHVEESYKCCAFCTNLACSSIYKNYFFCRKGIYPGYGQILPGIFPFTGSYADKDYIQTTPWMYKNPCAYFDRLEQDKYFRNFLFANCSITVSYYEVLEGIIYGICRGKRPCHICASVNMDIYDECWKKKLTEEDSPCYKIDRELRAYYSLILD